MARERIYRSRNVVDLDLDAQAGGKPIVGVDVAKDDFFAAVMNGSQKVKS